LASLLTVVLVVVRSFVIIQQLEHSKRNNLIIYFGSLEQSMDKSDIQVEDSNEQEILAGMLEPT
jgi:hypothetical protein